MSHEKGYYCSYTAIQMASYFLPSRLKKECDFLFQTAKTTSYLENCDSQEINQDF